MNRHESKDSCQHALDQQIDLDTSGKDLNSCCPECTEIIQVISSMQKLDSAYSTEKYPQLKQKILKKVAPLITKPAKPSIAEQLSRLFQNWAFNISLGTALAGLLLFALFVQQPAPNQPQLEPSYVELPSSGSHINDHHFLISMNGEAATSVSIDNPISLFAGQECIITAPDGSTLEARGPARLSVNPRGFHLFSGYIKADVVKDETRFVATTPHLQLQVLGTVFSLQSDSKSTLVEVSSGQVFVTPEAGESKKLSAGDSAHFSPDQIGIKTTETIPSLDSE